jgi:isoquinoline 1-oxidoreductase beta subunit
MKMTAPAMNRRSFLKVIGLSGAGFVVGCSARDDAAPALTGDATSAGPAAAVHDFNPFVRIGTDNTVTVISKHLDKGQGVTTGLATIVAEELDADWSQIKTEFAPANAAVYANSAFGIQGTGGSTSIANSWMQYREAAATAKAMLVAAAASEWGVPAAEISVSGGRLMHGDKAVSFGDIAAAAAGIEPPAEARLKDPSEFRLVGTRVHRLDNDIKTDGSAVFTIDVVRPGMLVALVAHPPKFGATVASFDAAAALDVPGVSDVVQIPRGVAVLANSFWSAKKGRDALTVDWDDSAAEKRGSPELRKLFDDAVAADEGTMARSDGNADEALANASNVIRREYGLPYLAHATMEPMDCVVEYRGDRCEIWTGSQLQTVDQNVVASILGLPPEAIAINTLWAGGSFGRRAVPNSDYVAEAAMIAKAIDGRAPVKLQWTREDDMRAGFYRPMSSHTLEAALDADGNISAWKHRTAAQSIFAGTPLSALIQDGIDPSTVEGSRELPYAIPNLNVKATLVETGIPVLWWRSVGHTQNAFVTETFFDELAREAGKDPVAWRQELLKDHPRHAEVLRLVAEKAGWGSDPGEGKGRGVALHESFGSVVAEIVDVTLNDNGTFAVDKVWCAVDCGIAVNPDIVAAQMEGAIGYALSAALRESVEIDAGEVSTGNFDRYQSLRINEMPAIEVHIVKSGNAPSGVGEPATPPLAPALVNALADASGKRIYRLPVGDQLRT